MGQKDPDKLQGQPAQDLRYENSFLASVKAYDSSMDRLDITDIQYLYYVCMLRIHNMGKEPVSAFWSWPYHPFLVGSILFLTTIRTYTSKHRYDRNEAVETRLFFSKGWPKWAEHFLIFLVFSISSGLCWDIKHISNMLQLYGRNWKKPCFSLVSEFQTAAICS